MTKASNLLVSEVFTYREDNRFLGLYIAIEDKDPKKIHFQTAFGWGGGVCGNLDEHIRVAGMEILTEARTREYVVRESLDYDLIPWEGIYSKENPIEKVYWGFSDFATDITIKKLRIFLEKHHKDYHKLKELIRQGEYEAAYRFLRRHNNEEDYLEYALSSEKEFFLDFYEGLREKDKRFAERLAGDNFYQMEAKLLHRLEKSGKIVKIKKNKS